MLIMRWLLLGLKEKAKVPECALKEVVGQLRGEPHPQKDLLGLGEDLERACGWPYQGGCCGLRRPVLLRSC